MYFAGSKKNEEEFKLFCVLLAKISRYVKISDDAKTMSFLLKDDNLLTKYNEIQSEIKKTEERKKFSSDQVFGDKYLKAAIVIDSVFKSGKKFYPQTFLEECKYKIKEKEINLFIEDILESYYDDNCEEKKEGNDFEENSE